MKRGDEPEQPEAVMGLEVTALALDQDLEKVPCTQLYGSTTASVADEAVMDDK
jgi:hypothetical protein